jgi:hypothetical protein
MAAERGRVSLGVEAGGRTFDAMSVGEARPRPQGEVIGALEVGYAAARDWNASVSGRFGGTWFDFTDNAGSSGNIEDDSWAVRSFVDRLIQLSGGRALRFGLGYEYAEGRSWVKNSFSSHEGPHTFASGAAFRAGIDQPWGSRVELHASLEQAVYHAHATDSSLGNTYNWLGRAFCATIGVRFIVMHGREEPDH